MRPTGRMTQFDTDPPPIDANEYWEWQCENPECSKPGVVPKGPWTVGRKLDGSYCNDPRWSQPIQIPKAVDDQRAVYE